MKSSKVIGPKMSQNATSDATADRAEPRARPPTPKKTSTHGAQLHALVRAHRIAAGLSQGELAARLGVARTTLAGWEAGTRVCNLHDLERIAHALGKTPAAIVGAPPGSPEFRLLRLAKVADKAALEAAILLLEASTVNGAAHDERHPGPAEADETAPAGPETKYAA